MITMKDDEWVFSFSTGKVFPKGHMNIIGINQLGNVGLGYDGLLEHFCEERTEPEWHRVPLTQIEREELADYMIGLWTRYKESKPSNNDSSQGGEK